MRCKHCGEPITFFRASGEFIARALVESHPCLLELQAYGGWWIHSSGPKRYMRLCAFGDTLEASMVAYGKYGNAKAEPAPEVAA